MRVSRRRPGEKRKRSIGLRARYRGTQLNWRRNLSRDDRRRRDRNLDCHVGCKAETAVGVSNLPLLMPVRDGERSSEQNKRNTKHTDEGSPPRSQDSCSVFAQHDSSIVAGRRLQAVNLSTFLGYLHAFVCECCLLDWRRQTNAYWESCAWSPLRPPRT
jgi:hypothetical protein